MSLHQSYPTIFSLLFLVSINSGLAQAQVITDATRPTLVEESKNRLTAQFSWLNPSDALSYYNRGVFYSRQGQTQLAIA